MSNLILYSVIMLIAGIGIPIMATLNGGLGMRLQSPALAAAILLFVGVTLAVAYLLVTEGIPKTLYLPNTPVYFYLGGFFVLFYILTITWVAPRFGITNAISLVLLGQLISMSIIDHFGFFGAHKFILYRQRFVGLGLMVLGVYLVLNKVPEINGTGL